MGVFGGDSSCTFFVIHRSECAIRLSSCKAGEQNGSFGRTLFEQRRIPKCANGMEALAARNHKTKSIQPVCDLRSEEHTSELQSHSDLVCRLLLEKKKKKTHKIHTHKNTDT